MATPAFSQGTVLLKPFVGALTDAAGNSIGVERLVVFVADLDGDGVQAPTATSFAPGSDDFVIGSLNTIVEGGQAFARGSFNINVDTSLYGTSGPTVENGDSFAMFWYPELNQTNFLTLDGSGNEDLSAWTAEAPGDTPYGAYTSNTWTVPSAGSAVDYRVFSQSAIGSTGVADDVLQAQFSTAGAVIPEPSSSLLSLLGTGLLLFRRRRA
ncbi:MAG: PEP-CTERM sorting domain-containing protein [Verrucomicrobiales bacterium]|jgi:hypothetical protein